LDNDDNKLVSSDNLQDFARADEFPAALLRLGD
jgi:hypothetical protein